MRVILIFCLIFSVYSVFAEDQGVLAMKSVDFDIWVENVIKKKDTDFEKMVANAVLTRLTADRRVSDQAIVSSVLVLANREANEVLDKNKRCQEVFQQIDALLVFLDKKSTVVAKLFSIKVGEFLVTKKNEEAFVAADAAEKLYQDIFESSVLARNRLLVHKGHLAWVLNNKTVADETFCIVMSFPWWIAKLRTKVGSNMDELKNCYLTAGDELIDLRRHNLAALESIYLPHGAHGYLIPKIEEAIIEAGGDPEKSPNIQAMKGKLVKVTDEHKDEK